VKKSCLGDVKNITRRKYLQRQANNVFIKKIAQSKDELDKSQCLYDMKNTSKNNFLPQEVKNTFNTKTTRSKNELDNDACDNNLLLTCMHEV
jgi:hypothetical protein